MLKVFYFIFHQVKQEVYFEIILLVIKYLNSQIIDSL
jgi:hypothetical protein